MNRELILGPEAEAEIAEASEWYERRSPGLGVEFIASVDAALAAIRQNPFQYQPYGDDFAAPGFADSLTV